MKWLVRTHNRGLLLLGVWLIATGASQFVHLTSLNIGPILAVLAVVAGVLIVLDR